MSSDPFDLRRLQIRLWLLLLAGLIINATGLSAAEPTALGVLRWWKGNLHTHSLWSDGDDYPEMIAEWYKQHGYHFLAFSDHNILLQDERWMVLTSRKAEQTNKPSKGP